MRTPHSVFIIVLFVVTSVMFGCRPADNTTSPINSSAPAVPTASVTFVLPTLTIPVPTAQPSPTAQASPTPDSSTRASAKPEESLFDTLLAPFVAEAQKRRAELARSDPEYARRIDPVLNEGRINFLLYGYGETHEPPSTEKAIIGSHTIISYDTRTRTADIVSLTHDIRGPEIERELAKKGNTKSGAVRIDQAYSVGGFKLMRQVLENATGLSVDFQLTFRDSVMQGVIDNVFQGVEVDVPRAFDVHPFYLDGVKYEQGSFKAGRQKLSGKQVVQFIKTVPITDGYYGRDLEHNTRKHLVFEGLLTALNKNYQDKWFWARASTFVVGQLATGTIVYDFDPVALMVNNLNTASPILSRLASGESTSSAMPKIKRSIYIVDPAHGEGGVQWVTANAAVNPITQKDIESGIYRSTDIEVPLNANPYGDLVMDYWTSVRQVVKQSFTSDAPTPNKQTASESTPLVTSNEPAVIVMPKSGEIIAKTNEKENPTGYVLVSADGKRTPIKPSVYDAFNDQTLSPDGKFRLTIVNNTVLSTATDHSRPPGTVAKAEGRKILNPPAIVGPRGIHGAVVQDGKEVLLFGTQNSSYQGVIFTAPPDTRAIEHLAWGSAESVNDLILTMRGEDNHVRVFRLSPAIAYPLPPDATKECGGNSVIFNDCAIKFYKRMPKNLKLVSDQGDYAASVAR